MKKIYQQWQLTVLHMVKDVITTSGVTEGTGYAWRTDDWKSVDDNLWD